MKVAALIELLQRFDPKCDVIIFRDACNYGYGSIDRIRSGLFIETDFGNDFYVDTALVIKPSEVKAICIYPEDYEAAVPATKPNDDKI